MFLRRFRVWWTRRGLRRMGLIDANGLTPLGLAVMAELAKGASAPHREVTWIGGPGVEAPQIVELEKSFFNHPAQGGRR